MTTTDTYKRLADVLVEFEEKTRAVQESLERLDAARKDKDTKGGMEDLDEQLRLALQNLYQMEQEMKDTQDGINEKLGRQSVKSAPFDRRSVYTRTTLSTPHTPYRRQLVPDEQEMQYELKSQLMKNVEMQNQKLKTEFTLHEKMTESRLLSQQNKKLHDDVTMSRANSLKLIKMFERKAREADAKLREMKSEVSKSQDLADKYRNLYELERRKNAPKDGGDTLPPLEESMDANKLPPSSYSFLGPNVRVNDVIRKNEVLLDESKGLKMEVKRLKEDNQRLIRQTRQAMVERDQSLHRLETSETNRKNLLKRLEKEKGQHQQLSRSLTRQASDWILLKKQIAQFDEEYRWSQVIGHWIEKGRGRGKKILFPPLAPESLQELAGLIPRIARNEITSMSPTPARDGIEQDGRRSQ